MNDWVYEEDDNWIVCTLAIDNATVYISITQDKYIGNDIIFNYIIFITGSVLQKEWNYMFPDKLYQTPKEAQEAFDLFYNRYRKLKAFL
jgi:hypothetical protein